MTTLLNLDSADEPVHGETLVFDSATKTWRPGPGGGGGVTDHGDLSGLGDDDHAQYLNTSRGDGRYYTKSQSDAALSGKSGTGHLHDDRYYTEAEADDRFVRSVNGTGPDVSGNVTVTTGPGGATDHGALTGLTDDDHPQYLTTARGDARYYTEAEVDAALSGKAATGHTHTLDQATDTAARVAMTPAERSKLGGIASAATANATDAQLRSRSTHTGSQDASTISDLAEAVQDIVGAALVAGAGTTVTYNDTAGTVTITAAAGTTDPEVVRDTIGAALVAGAGITVTVNDAADTITISSTAVLPTRQVIAGTGLTGGGTLAADRTLTLAPSVPHDAWQASTGVWPSRPTVPAGSRVNWIGYPGNTTPPTAGGAGAVAGTDSYVARP